MSFLRPRWFWSVLLLCLVLPALVFSDVVPGPPFVRLQLDAGTPNRLLYNASPSGALSDLAAITSGRVLVSNANGLPVANAALTAGRLLIADPNGLPLAHSALTAGRLLFADPNGLPAANAALTGSRLLLTDANALPTSRAALTANRLVLSGTDGLLDVNAALTASMALQSDGSGFPVASSTVSATELGYLDGVNSSIQGQLNALGATGMVLLQTYSPSGASSVDITSGLTSTYEQYLLTISIYPASNGDLYLRTDSDGGASFETSGYGCGGSYQGTGASNGVYTSSACSSAGLSLTGGRGGATYIGSAVRITSLGTANNYPTFTWATYVDPWNNQGGGTRQALAAINAIRIISAGGNISGKVRLYGLLN